MVYSTMQDAAKLLPESDTTAGARESLAYIAGLFDGEGYATAHVQQTHNRYCYSIRIGICSNCWEVINYIDVLLLGHINTRVPKNANHATRHTIYWSGGEAVGVLELILPYLIIKREAADLVITMWYECFNGRFDRHNVLAEADRVLRDNYISRIRSCNRRGPRE